MHRLLVAAVLVSLVALAGCGGGGEALHTKDPEGFVCADSEKEYGRCPLNPFFGKTESEVRKKKAANQKQAQEAEEKRQTRASAGALALQPDPPVAGQALAARVSVLVGDAPVTSAKVACPATVAGNALQATSSRYRSGTALCTWRVPVTSASRVISGTVRATSSAGSVLRSFRARIQAPAPRVEITSFSHRGIYPLGITAGPDGALYFTNGDSIGRITTSGLIRIYKDTSIRNATGITVGPDGALWFTNDDSIGRITTSGKVTVYTSKSIRHLGDSITAGPDGALWFTMYDEGAMYDGDPRASGIGRITTSGKVTVYRNRGIDGPGGITAGPDGALWFTMFNYKRPYAGIGRITTRGGVTATSLDADLDGMGPSLGITVGPDRAVWFTHPRVDFYSIGRISTTGEVKILRDRQFRWGLSDDGITSGPDGALWFINGNSIGRITTGGFVSVYRDESIKSSHEIAGITTGPDKAIWFTNPSGESIGRLRIVSAG